MTLQLSMRAVGSAEMHDVKGRMIAYNSVSGLAAQSISH